MSSFKKATKEKCKARVAIFGPPGSGKTYTSLSIAKGLGKSIALIDSEHRTASKYSDRFDFDVVELDKDKTIEMYTEKIKEAGEAGYEVLIIDSLTHAWQELVQEISDLAETSRYKGNGFRAWAKGTPKQIDFIETILDCPCHIIATMRSGIEYSIDKDDKNRQTITKVGLAPKQGKDIEYEFDILMEMDINNNGFVSKDRSGKFQGKTIKEPNEKFGKELAEWLNDGAEPAPRPKQEKKKEEVDDDNEEIWTDDQMVLFTTINNAIKNSQTSSGLNEIVSELKKLKDQLPESLLDTLRTEYTKRMSLILITEIQDLCSKLNKPPKHAADICKEQFDKGIAECTVTEKQVIYNILLKEVNGE